MVIEIQSLAEIGGEFDALVFDQWGVLHDGSVPYPGVPDALRDLANAGHRLAVLSNSGRRSAANADRISAIGFEPSLFDEVMTSGEALWRDLNSGRLGGFERLFAVASTPGDSEEWAKGLTSTTLVRDPAEADAVLLMGLSDHADLFEVERILEIAHSRGLQVLCSNPDLASPRAGGKIVKSIGALAKDYERSGGRVTYYGKPHEPVFRALARALESEPQNLLMVGDSLDHDISGAKAAGWKSAFVRGGLHAEHFHRGDPAALVKSLAASMGAPEPDYTLNLAR